MNDTTHPTTTDQGDERRAIIRAAVAAMPSTNPLVADDLIEGHTMHTEADDIVAIWKAAQRAAAQPVAQPVVDQKSASASDNASCGSQVSDKPVGQEAIPPGFISTVDVEKLLCAKLGREWTPAGISIASLIEDLWSEGREFGRSDTIAAPPQPASAEAGKGVTVVVPWEPTTAMVNAGQCGCMDNDVTVSIYKAMLAAVPSESVAVSGEVSDSLSGQWQEAYAAFKGAFDTPQTRRLHADEYSNDARQRLRAFNDAVLALAGSAKQAAALERMARLDDEMGIEP